ncbi:MAG: ParB/RepB/Spo0J family partition protein [Oscillospiraceae bacterium]|nr:ParB/RepB/Spo0J family partition protein [Oscillospiraceae bacterium]
MKQKGLGTGLGALFGEAANDSSSVDFEYLPIVKIEPRPEQPRYIFREDGISELAESIREHGIMSPLTVRLAEDGIYQIIAGERRWRAARLAGLTEVPARIIVADDKKAMELALVENLQREDLNPLEEARGYKALIDEFDMTQEEVSQRVSKSRPAVTNSLRLLTLPDTLVEMVESGTLNAGSARALIPLNDAERMTVAARRVVKDGMSVRDVEALVKKLKTSPKKDYGTGDVDYMLEAQHRLTQTLGRRVTIKQNKDKGKIEIEYYNQDDFNELFVALTGGAAYE